MRYTKERVNDACSHVSSEVYASKILENPEKVGTISGALPPFAARSKTGIATESNIY